MASDVLSGVGAQQEGMAKEAAANYNASLQEQQADMTLKQSAEDERRFRIGTRKQMGENRVAVGTSGVTTEGSALDVLQESASNAELDALTMRHKGQVDAYNLRAGANVSRFQGEQARTAANFQTAAAGLRGIENVVSKGAKGFL